MIPVQRAAQAADGIRPRTTWRFVALGICAALVAACGDSNRAPVKAVTAEGPSTPVRREDPAAVRVALIMKTLTNPFFVEMERGARRAQQESGIDLQVKTATQETSIDQQIKLVEDEITAKAKAIVIAPGDSARLVPVLKRAQDAGIQIVNIDNRLSPEAMAAAGMKPVPFISVDNEKGAYEAAKFIADQIHRPMEVAVLEGIRSANNAQQRKHGAERGFRSNAYVRIAAEETANWKIDEAYVVTEKLFKQHPGIGALFCSNDMMAIGAMKYLQESGRTQVLVAGFDALDEAKAAIRARELAVTVDQQAAEQGYLGIMTVLKLLRGQPASLDIVVETRLITRKTLE
jgi:ribose transport system substrate-binding protein